MIRSRVFLFAGQAGTRKREVLSRLARFLATESRLPPDLDDPATRRHVQVFSLEERVVRGLGAVTIKPLLESLYPQRQEELWRDATIDLLHELSLPTAPDIALVALHCTFACQGILLSTADWDQLAKFNPQAIVVLVDDLADVLARIHQTEAERRESYDLSLTDLLEWRAAEATVAELLARQLRVSPTVLAEAAVERASLPPDVQLFFGDPVPFYVCPVKHPLATLYRTLFSPDALRVYLSYPVTNIVDDEESVQLVNDARLAFHAVPDIALFDPLTVDDLRFSPSSSRKPLLWRDRWPLGIEQPMLSPADGAEAAYRKAVKASRISILYSRIAAQVRRRDLQLLSQCHAVVVFRPYLGGSLSRGAAEELFVARVSGKQTYVIHDSGDARTDPHPFAPFGGITTYPDMDSAKSALRALAARHREVRLGR